MSGGFLAGWAGAGQMVLARGFENSLTFSEGQYEMMLASSVFAFLALFGGMLYNLQTRGEVGAKYRATATTSAIICGVAALSYLIINLSWITGFDYVDGQFVPSDSPLQFRAGYRYVDWSVTVPLLMAEFLAVLGLVGAKARNARATLMALAFAMIVTGFLGAEIYGSNDNDTQRWIWGAISTVPYVLLYLMLIPLVRRSMSEMSEPVSTSTRNALILLLAVWGTYPLAYMVPLFFEGQNAQEWAVGRQIAFSVADVVAKVGFGSLIHKIAKMRTAEEVNEGEETHPEAVYVSHDKLSEARPPQVVLDGDGHRPASVGETVRVETSSSSRERSRESSARRPRGGASAAGASDPR